MGYDRLNATAEDGTEETWLVFRSEPYVAGLNNRYQPQYIPLTAYSDGSNVDLDDVTRPARRDGFSSCMGTSGLATTTARPSSLIYYNPSTAANRKIIMPVDAVNKTYYATAIGGNWTEIVTAATASIDPGTAEPVLFVVNDFVIMLRQSGGEPVSINSSGIAVVGAGGNTEPPDSGVDGCSLQNRAMILVGGAPTRLYYSKLIPTPAAFAGGSEWDVQAVPTSPELAGSFQLSPERGGIPVACRPWNGTSVVVWFDSCIEEVVPGTAYGSTFYSSASRSVIERNIGCCSREGVVASGSEFFFPDQYGQIRSLTQTISGAQQGVAGKPLSEPIKGYIPDRVNSQVLSKIRSIIFRDKMYVAFPLDTSTESNAVAVYSLSTRMWEGVWRLANAVGRWVISNLRGFGDELYFSDGSTTTGPVGGGEATKVYRLFDSSYADNGSPTVFEWMSPAYDFGCPESAKVLELLELDVRADGGITADVAVQVNEDGRWISLTAGLQTQNAQGVWISYVMSYPLVDPALVSITRLRAHLGEVGNYGRCRFARVRVREQTAGKRFQIAGMRLMARPQPYEMEE